MCSVTPKTAQARVEDLGSLVFSRKKVMEIINAIEEDLGETAQRVAKATFRESFLARGDELDFETVRFQIKDQMGRMLTGLKCLSMRLILIIFTLNTIMGKSGVLSLKVILSLFLAVSPG